MAIYNGNSNNNTYAGTSSADTIYGNGGNDTLSGAAADDSIYGGDGTDILNGGDGSDFLEGNAGNDTISSGIGNDLIYGGDGDDIINGGKGDDFIEGGIGAETYLFAKGDGKDIIDNYDNQSGVDVVKFTDAASTEVTVSRSGTNLIVSYGTGDSITIKYCFDYGPGGHIGLFFNPTETRIHEIQFSDGVTWMWSDIEAKTSPSISSTEGDDVLNVNYDETNIIYGLGGNDRIYGGNLADTLDGGAENDFINGYGGNDTLLGSDGDDSIEGGDGDDMFIGGKGDDFTTDLDSAGYGSDTYLFAKGDGKDEIWDYGGNDVVKFTDLASTELTMSRSFDFDESLMLSFSNGDSIRVWGFFDFGFAGQQIEEFQFSDGMVLTMSDIKTKFLQATAGDDYIQGYDSEANTINGLAGNDVLLGGDGNDKLNGGTGADAMSGGAGNDSYTVDNIGDSITELANSSFSNEGTDLVTSSINWTLGANLENLSLSGTKAINGSGNSLNNTINGNAAANTMSGNAGADSLKGGNGTDVLVGGIGKDKLYLAETTAVTDTVKIATGDSKWNGYDVIVNFALGNGVINTNIDRLDLDTTTIADNAAAIDAKDKGIIKSHSISNGLISFDDVDSFAASLVLSASNMTDVFGYLQNNINSGNTVAFNAVGNTYVFQDGGLIDTVVQLTGVTANNINTTGLVADGVWLV